jgi:hypothetical protein
MEPPAREAPPSYAEEVGMPHAFFRIGAVGLLVVCTVCAVSLRAAAESKQITLAAKRPPGYISRTVVTPGDISKHEVAQEVVSYEITSPEADFNGFKTVNYGQSDSVAGTGTHRGYATWPLKNGDTVYIKFEGSHKTVTKDGGAWESSFEGKFEFVSGTGKYKNIKGTGTYKGKGSPEGSMWDAVADMQY